MHVKLHFKLAGETSGQMSIVIIMAVILEEELRERGIRSLTQLDREQLSTA